MSGRGFTILELLVTMFLSLLVAALALSALTVSRSVLGKDQVRIQLAQNLRGSLDIIGIDVRVGGENLGTGFPAIETTNGAGICAGGNSLHDGAVPNTPRGLSGHLGDPDRYRSLLQRHKFGLLLSRGWT